jgi:hypothetical protein
MILEDNFCGCNAYTGCSCQETEFFQYSGSGTFPMKKGTRGEHVKHLQVALNTKFNTPANLRIITPTEYWGDKTQKLIEYHDLPSEIPNAQVLQAILEGKNPKKMLAGVLAGVSQSQNIGENRSTNTWQSALKDPNQAIGLFGQLTQSFATLQAGRNRNQQSIGFGFGQSDSVGLGGGFQAGGSFQASGQFGQNQQPRRMPNAVWIAVGLIVVLLIGLIVFKAMK